MVFFSRIDKLEIPEFGDANTDLPENHQYNGAMAPVNTQPYPPHSPLEDALVSSTEPPPHPHVEAGDATLQAQEGDLPDVQLIGDNYMLYGVYQDLVQHNPVDHLDGVIAEDSKWRVR